MFKKKKTKQDTSISHIDSVLQRACNSLKMVNHQSDTLGDRIHNIKALRQYAPCVCTPVKTTYDDTYERAAGRPDHHGRAMLLKRQLKAFYLDLKNWTPEKKALFESEIIEAIGRVTAKYTDMEITDLEQLLNEIEGDVTI